MKTVSEIARSTNLSTDTIRYYVRIGLLTPQRQFTNNYRLFSDKDAQLLKFIHHCKLLGYTLQEIANIIRVSHKGESPCPQVREIIQSRIEENRLRLKELQALQLRMENALHKWEQMPNGEPNGHSICHLIESVYAQ